MKRILLIVALLLLPSLAHAQGGGLMPDVLQQFNDELGLPLFSGFVCTTLTGTSNSNLPTYPTAIDAQNLTNPNANPVLLDSAGRGTIWLGTGTYRIVTYKAGTGNTCNGTVVGAAVKTVNGVAGYGSLLLLNNTWTGTNTFTGAVTATAINNRQYCITGANLGSKAAAALAALGGPGIADCSNLSGAATQAITANVTIGTGQTLVMPAAPTTLSASIVAPNAGAVLAGPVPCTLNTNCPASITRSGTAAMLVIGGNSGAFPSGIYVHDISFNGNGSAGDCIDLNYAYNVYIDRVHCYNGGASSALNLTGNVFDAWINDGTWYVWGDATHPTINLAGGVGTVTDIHFNGNQIGENGNSNPSVISDANTVQVSWIDNKFHTTGTSQPWKILWGGYRSRWIGNSFQADAAGCTDGMIHFTLGPNDLAGNTFTDVNNCSAIVLSGTGQANITGGTVTGTAAGSGAILTTATFGGIASVNAVMFEGMNTAMDTSLGAGTLSIIGNNFTGVTNTLKVNLTNTYQPIKNGYPTKYTPTYTGVANVTSTGGVQTAMYTVVNDIVTVDGTFVSVTPTTAATLTTLDIALPVTSTLSAQNDCIGLSSTNSVASEVGTILADMANHKCELFFIPTTNSTRTVVLRFSYRIDGILPETWWQWLTWNLAGWVLWLNRRRFDERRRFQLGRIL